MAALQVFKHADQVHTPSPCLFLKYFPSIKKQSFTFLLPLGPFSNKILSEKPLITPFCVSTELPNYILLFSNSQTVPSGIPILLLSPFKFLLLYFSVIIFVFAFSFYYLFITCWVFYFSIYFKRGYPYLWKHVYNICFKFLIITTSIIISGLVYIFVFSFENSDFLGSSYAK